MYVLLRERYLDAVLVECVVNGVEHVTDDIGLLGGVCPYEHLQVDT